MSRSLFTLLRKFKKSQSGVTVIEFAFVAPAFLLVFLGLFETGLMLFNQDGIQAAMVMAAREIRTGQAHQAKLSQDEFKNKICKKLSGMIKCGDLKVTVVTASNFKELNKIMPTPASVGAQLDSNGNPKPTPYGCGAPYDAVGVVAVYDWKFKTPFLGGILGNTGPSGSRRIYGSAVFRNENYSNTTEKCR